MLTRRHALIEYDCAKRRAQPDRLTRRAHRRYLEYAHRMLDVYRQGTGRTRRALHESVERVFRWDDDCPPRRVEAFCKLLDDRTEFDRATRREAAELRRAVFRRAAAYHPLLVAPESPRSRSVGEVRRAIASELGCRWSEIEARLFADCLDYQRLRAFDDFHDPAMLLARYNVGQIQAALYDALSLTIWAEQDFKTILRAAKLARLMHEIWRLQSGSYRIRLDGPASILRPTPRYGAALARFLPSLLACRRWRMHAVLRPKRPRGEFQLALSADDGFRSYVEPAAPFDSHVEQQFAADWGAERDGWQLMRESDILHRGQMVFLPDFTFQHTGGARVLLEIVGFWTDDYLRAKARTLQAFADQPILLAVAESVARRLPSLPAHDVITYRKRLKVEQVQERLRVEG